LTDRLPVSLIPDPVEARPLRWGVIGAGQFGILRPHGSYEDLVSDPEVFPGEQTASA
jgi:hypothetical protein